MIRTTYYKFHIKFGTLKKLRNKNCFLWIQFVETKDACRSTTVFTSKIVNGRSQNTQVICQCTQKYCLNIVEKSSKFCGEISCDGPISKSFNIWIKSKMFCICFILVSPAAQRTVWLFQSVNFNFAHTTYITLPWYEGLRELCSWDKVLLMSKYLRVILIFIVY